MKKRKSNYTNEEHIILIFSLEELMENKRFRNSLDNYSYQNYLRKTHKQDNSCYMKKKRFKKKSGGFYG